MKTVKIGNKLIEIIENGIVTHRILNDSDERNQQIKQYILDHPEEYSVEYIDSDKTMADLVDDEKGLNAQKSLFE